LTLILVIRASPNIEQIVSSMAERINAPFLPQPTSILFDVIIHIVASLDIKVLYNDYLCLVTSNKQQIQW